MDLFDPRGEIIMSMTNKDLHYPWTVIDPHQPAPTCHGRLMPERIPTTTLGTDLRTAASQTVVRARRATHALTRTATRALRGPSTSGRTCAFTLPSDLTSAIRVRWHSRDFTIATDTPSCTLVSSPLSVHSATTSLFDQMLCVVIWAVEVERDVDKRSRQLLQQTVRRQLVVPPAPTWHRLRPTPPQLWRLLLLQQQHQQQQLRRRLLPLEQRQPRQPRQARRLLTVRTKMLSTTDLPAGAAVGAACGARQV